jgi:hypothetical protein
MQMIDLIDNRQTSGDGLDIYIGLSDNVGQKVKARFMQTEITPRGPVIQGDLEFELMAMYGDKKDQISASDCLIRIDDPRYPEYTNVILALYSNGMDECLKIETADPNLIKEKYGDQFPYLDFKQLQAQLEAVENFG